MLLAFLLRNLGRIEEARAVLEPARQADVEPDQIVRAEGLAELAALAIFGGNVEEGGPLLEEALSTLEEQQAWAPLANVLITRGVYLIYQHRAQEGEGVLRHALSIAQRYDLSSIVLRARYNLASISLERDDFDGAVEEVQQALTLARERGDRSHERRLLGQLVAPLYALGRWNEAVAHGSVLLAGVTDVDSVFAASVLATVATARRDEQMLDRCRAIAAELRDSVYTDQRFAAEVVFVRDAVEGGSYTEALSVTQAALEQTGLAAETVEEAYALSVEAAVSLGDEAALEALIEAVSQRPPASATPLLRAGQSRLRAELAHRQGDADATRRHEDEAIQLLRSIGARPLLARALVERARRHPDTEALAEAGAIFTELEATRWLDRINEVPGVAAA